MKKILIGFLFLFVIALITFDIPYIKKPKEINMGDGEIIINLDKEIQRERCGRDIKKFVNKEKIKDASRCFSKPILHENGGYVNFITIYAGRGEMDCPSGCHSRIESAIAFSNHIYSLKESFPMLEEVIEHLKEKGYIGKDVDTYGPIYHSIEKSIRMKNGVVQMIYEINADIHVKVVTEKGKIVTVYSV